MLKSLLVHLEPDTGNEGLLAATADLASRFGSHVTGIAVCQPVQTMVGDDMLAGEVVLADRAEMEKELAATEKQFRAAMQGLANSVDWRCAITYGGLAEYIATQANCDLILSGPERAFSLLENGRRVGLGDLALQAGRPVLILPADITKFSLRHVVVGCRDTRESRRAAADAIPLLQIAQQVSVLELATKHHIEPARARVNDMAAWLLRHGVKAQPLAVEANGMEATDLYAQLATRRCDLFVAGAYGHSRLGEFVLGGVTRDVLLRAGFPVLISH